MKKLILSTLLLSMSLLIYATGSPEYASEKTKDIIEKMINAHGGYEKWASIEAMSFSSIMHSQSLGALRFWINNQVTELETKRSYQDWPLIGSKMTFDGNKAWSVNWRVGNPPAHQHSVFFYYLNLPWLTQDENVKLSEAQLIKHKAFDNEVYKVEMSFKAVPILGKSQKDSYTLYIDKQSYLLVGYEYTVGYGPMLDILGLPKDKEVFGPVLRKNNYIGDVNGLKFPMLFTTHDADYNTQYGDHAIYNINLNAEFDEQRMIAPENAVLDPGLDVRK